jgi:hypothetical protein
MWGFFFFIFIISNQNSDNIFYKLIWWLLGEHSPVMSWWGLLQRRVLFLNSSNQLAIFFLVSCCWKVVLLTDVRMCWDLLFFGGVLGCLFWSLLWQRALSNREVSCEQIFNGAGFSPSLSDLPCSAPFCHTGRVQYVNFLRLKWQGNRSHPTPNNKREIYNRLLFSDIKRNGRGPHCKCFRRNCALLQ